MKIAIDLTPLEGRMRALVIVTKDVPDGCTVVGVPAKIIKTKNEGR